jgi:hypothetical protein
MNPIDVFIMNYNAQQPTTDSLVQGSIYFPRQTASAVELDYRHPVNIIEDEDEDEQQQTIVHPEYQNEFLNYDPYRIPLRQTADNPESYYAEGNAISEPLRLTNPDSMHRLPTLVFPNIIGSDETTDNETDDDSDTDLDDVVTPSAPRPMVREQPYSQRNRVTTIEQIAFSLARRTSRINTNNIRANNARNNSFARQ